MATKICSRDDCDYPVFSKGFCRYHYPRKPIKKVSNRSIVKKEIKKQTVDTDFLFYLYLWNNCLLDYHNHYCYECGKGLSQPLLNQFHHLLYKASYPDCRYWIENICILCGDCHNRHHNNTDKTPKVKQLTETIKKELEMMYTQFVEKLKNYNFLNLEGVGDKDLIKKVQDYLENEGFYIIHSYDNSTGKIGYITYHNEDVVDIKVDETFSNPYYDVLIGCFDILNKKYE